MKSYPKKATERFDTANFHINYCLSFMKKYIGKKVLEIGAGCGSFSKNYIKKNNQVTLTELDEKNILDLKEKFSNFKNIKVDKKPIKKVKGNFDSILYLHVLEHIKNDNKELAEANKRLKKGGYLIIMVPAHPKIYSNLDKAVGHYRRYEKKFFKKNLHNLSRQRLLFLDSIGYWLYYFNKIFFKKEVFPSSLKIFIWDKFFTPLTIIIDFLTNYKFGKCILAVYKKNI